MRGRAVGDLQDALDHAGEQGDVLEQLRLEDFAVSPVRALRLQDAYRFDDVGAWAEWQKGELAAESPTDRRHAVTSFRGKDWAARALTWTPKTMPPIVIVERADGTTVIGDGRGRVSYAIGMGWLAIPAVFLKERERRSTPKGHAAGQSAEGTPPTDDFSVALWAFAERALERTARSGITLAQIVYQGGEPIFGRASPLHGTTVVAAVSLYRTPPAKPVNMRRFWESAPPPVRYWVSSDGSLRRRSPGEIDPRLMGNILTWKFKKDAFAVPKVHLPVRRGER